VPTRGPLGTELSESFVDGGSDPVRAHQVAPWVPNGPVHLLKVEPASPLEVLSPICLWSLGPHWDCSSLLSMELPPSLGRVPPPTVTAAEQLPANCAWVCGLQPRGRHHPADLQVWQPAVWLGEPKVRRAMLWIGTCQCRAALIWKWQGQGRERLHHQAQPE